MTESIDIHKAAGIIVRDRTLLVERSKGKDFFIAPGGSLEAGETPEQALVRELKEEFQIHVVEEDLVFFGLYKAAAAGQEEKIVEMTVFTVMAWQGEPTADSEVEEIAWVNSSSQLKLGSIFEHEVMPRLIAADVID
jgi:8-oxo-dGTP diphosphatase